MRYYEVDKGRFEAGLVRASNNPYYLDVLVAYTDGDELKLTKDYNPRYDKDAVTEFAESYDITVNF